MTSNRHSPFIPDELLTADRLNGMVDWLASRIDQGRAMRSEPGWLRRPGEAGWNTEHSVDLVDASVPRRLAVRVQYLRVITSRGGLIEVDAPTQFVVDLPRSTGGAVVLCLQRRPDGTPAVTAVGGPEDVPIARLTESAGTWKMAPDWLPPSATVDGCVQLQTSLSAIARRLHEALVTPNAHPCAEAARATFFAAWFGALGDGDTSPRRYLAVGRQMLAELGRLSGWTLPAQSEPAPYDQGLGAAVADWATSVGGFLQHWAKHCMPTQAQVEIREVDPVGGFRCLELTSKPNLGTACQPDGTLQLTAQLDLPDGSAEVRLSSEGVSPLVYEQSWMAEVRDGSLALGVQVPQSAQSRCRARLWVVTRSLTKR